MSSAESNSVSALNYAAPKAVPVIPAAHAPRASRSMLRVFLTLSDQAVVSIATFATNFLLLHHFAKDKEHYAYYTLAFNLMIWVAECHATLVFTPHTIMSPRRTGQALRRFHGSTLLHHFAVSIVAMFAMLIAGAWTHDSEMAGVLFVLALGTLPIGLRNYARPYSFTARKPLVALLLDVAVTALQISGLLLLQKMNRLNAATAVAMVAAASAIPALVWLLFLRRGFSPSLHSAVDDLKEEWPNTRWVFLSGMVWNAGMSLYPWVILALAGKEEVALYGACYQLAAVANPLLMGLQNFTGPRIAEAFTERDRHAFVRFVYRTAVWTSLLMVGPAVLLAMFADHALSWISKGEFHGHQTAIALLCGAFTLQAITFTLSRGLFALRRADLDLYCNFGPLLLMLTGGALLTKHYGATGAGASLLCAQLISTSSRAILFAYAARRVAAGDTLPPTPEDMGAGA